MFDFRTFVLLYVVTYQTEKHRGFAFVEFELPEDAQAAIDNMNDSELFGRTLKVSHHE